MNKETLQLIDKLAAKLGVATDYLWSVLIKQAFVSGITDIIQYVVIVALCIFLIKKHKHFCNKDNKWSYYEMEDGLGIPMTIAGVVAAFLLLCLFFCVPNTFTKFANPEYWALEQILDTVK